VVGHAGINRVILCEAVGVPLANVFKFGQDYGCLNILEFEDRSCRVKLLNFSPQNALQKPEQVVSEQETLATP
jgi:probable phosphoglycerate mutase